MSKMMRNIRDGDADFSLESEGYAVMEAEDGRQGLYCLNEKWIL